MMERTFRTSFITTLAIVALLLAALTYRLTTPCPRPQPAAQCFDLFEGLCGW